jgi:hypothetical protein
MFFNFERLKMKKFILLLIILLLSIKIKTYSEFERIDWPWNGFPNSGYMLGYITVDKNIPNNIFCSMADDKFYFSSDNGDNWTKIENYIESKGSMVKIQASYPNILIISSSHDSLKLSNDYGKTWRELDSIFCKPKFGDYSHGCPIKYNNINIINDKFYVATNYGPYMSSDNGLTWIPLYQGERFKITHAVFERDNNIFIGTRDDAVYKTTNLGLEWINIRNGMKQLGPIFDIINFKEFLIAVSYWPYSYYISSSNGDNWEFCQFYNESIISSITPCGNNLFITFLIDGPHFSRDTGKSWIAYNKGLPYFNDKNGFNVTGLTLNDKFLFVTTGGWDDGMHLYRAPLKDCEIVGATEVPESSEQGVETPCSIYPNPATERVFIEFGVGSWEFGVGEIEVYNVLGERNLTPALSKGEGVFEVDVSSLAAGVYYVAVKNAMMVIREKFVIAR